MAISPGEPAKLGLTRMSMLMGTDATGQDANTNEFIAVSKRAGYPK